MTMNPEELLEHFDFIHSLARSLVLDTNQAADIEQQTWLAALQNPPSRGTPIRLWLSKVALNFARKMYRSETRRTNHEHISSDSKYITSPYQILEQEEIRRSLIDAVLGLDEPYKTAVILRYYDGLKPKEIAKRLNIPVERVWTHLKRGLAQLRWKLDAQNSGDRRKWIMALAPIAGLQLGETSSAAIGTGSIIAGAIAMSMKIKIGIAAAFIIGMTFTLFHLFQKDLDGPGAPPVIESKHTYNEGSIDDSVSGINIDNLNPGINNSERDDLKPAGFVFSGKVINKITGESVTAFDLAVYGDVENGMEKEVFRETVQHEEGLFSFPINKSEIYSIKIRSSQYMMKHLKDLTEFRPDELSNLIIALDPGDTINGIVLEDDTGGPVSDAIVGPSHTGGGLFLLAIERDQDEACSYSRTDSKGIFTLSGFEISDRQTVIAVHPDFAQGVVKLTEDTTDDLVIRLKRGFCAYGRVLNDNGEPFPEATVMMSDTGIFGHTIPTLSWSTRTDKEGYYKTGPVKGGKVTLWASGEHKAVTFIDSDVEVNFGPSPDDVTWRGTIFGFDKKPVADARLYANLIESNASYNSYRYFSRSNDDGGFRFRKLIQGSYDVSIHIPGGTQGIEWDSITFYNPGKLEKDIHLTGGTIRGVITDPITGSVIIGRKGRVTAAPHCHRIKRFYGKTPNALINDKGIFCIEGFRPGVYTLDVWLDDLAAYESGINGRKRPVLAGTLSGVKIDQFQVIKRLSIPIASRGRLKLKIYGFDINEKYRFSLALKKHGGPWKTHLGYSHEIKEGALEGEHLLETGEWSVLISFYNLGLVKHDFCIHAGQITNIEVRRDEFKLFEGSISVTGGFKSANGSPIKGALLSFYPKTVPGLSKSSKKCKTDDQGQFLLEGLKPGQWSVSANLANGEWSTIHTFLLPKDTPNPYQLELKLEPGVVWGRLVNSKTDVPLNKTDGQWRVVLIDLHWEESICWYAGNNDHGEFRLVGVPPGEYMIKVVTRAYIEFHSGSFSLTGDQELDMGDIGLAPSSLVDLKVVDTKGKLIKNYTGSCNGKPLSFYWGYNLITDEYQRYLVPRGFHTFRVEAMDYKPEKFSLSVSPGQPVTHKVILNSK